MTRARDVADTQDNLGGPVAPVVAGKNIIINGAMEIDQRNNGAALLLDGDGRFGADRWLNSISQANKVTFQRVTDAPNGFTNSYRLTQTNVYSTPGAGDYIGIYQTILGTELARLALGTASAQPVAISFWVKSSVTGTYGVGFREQSTATAAYVTPYTINSANTWEKKIVLVPAAIVGTWANTNTSAAIVYFSVSMGATYQGSTSNTWLSGSSATNAHAPSTLSNTFWTTSGATFQFTGVQLEQGSQATSFSRAAGTLPGELTLCQTYYTRWQLPVANYSDFLLGQTYSGTQAAFLGQIPVQMRATPTGARSGLAVIVNNLGSRVSGGTFSISASSNRNFSVTYTHGSSVFGTGQVAWLQINNSATDYLELSAEL